MPQAPLNSLPLHMKGPPLQARWTPQLSKRLGKGMLRRAWERSRLESHTSCQGAPSSSAMTCMASLLLKDGTLSHSFCSSFMAAGDRMSGLMDSACPSCRHAHALCHVQE